MVRVLLILTFLAVCSCGCREHLHGTPEEMEAQMQRLVPVGTSLLDARRIMEQYGFTCSQTSTALVCDLTEHSGFVYSYHHASLSFDRNGALSGLQMTTTFKGP